jgi:hypothetical protein
MRLSRVPVPSLDRRDLVYDPGGLRHVSPYRRRRILRSSAMKLSAFALEKEQASHPRLILQDHHFKPLSRLNTDPADLLPSASDLCFLRPTSSATGLVASLCPREDFHLLDDINWFHRGSQPRIPTATDLTRHDSA